MLVTGKILFLDKVSRNHQIKDFVKTRVITIWERNSVIIAYTLCS